MTTIKQRIRMFAQWATAMGALHSTDDFNAVAQPDHRGWLVELHLANKKEIKLIIAEVPHSAEYQIKSLSDDVIWQDVPSDTNFNLAMRAALDQLA